MAKDKAYSRVNGRNGENMSLEGDELNFRVANKVERMPKEVVNYISVVNTGDARELVRTCDLVPYGAWTEEMPSTGGKSMFLVVKGRASIWVMEITKSQVPNASSFCEVVMPREKDDENKRLIPNRAINTPLGAVFTIGSIVCLILAVFLVFTMEQPLLGLIAAGASIAMYINVK